MNCLCGCKAKLPPGYEHFATNECVEVWVRRVRIQNPDPNLGYSAGSLDRIAATGCARLDGFNRCPACASRPGFACPQARKRGIAATPAS